MKIKLVETFDETPSISMMEHNDSNPKSSRVDGKYIIGMIEGQFFKPDGMSRNGRWYPKSLWTKSLAKADTKNRLANSTMFGEIGHSDGPVEDMTLRQGCASHFIDDLWIDEKGRGMGRAYILNTPTGQLLKIYLGAGCKLKVSTRGEGNYKEGETHDGCPVVDDDTYDFQTVDFVLNPGFLETSAILKESYNRLNSQKIDNKQIEETIAHVKKEGEKRMELNIDAYVTDLKEELKSVKAENKSLNEQLQAKNNELLQSQLNANAEVNKLKEELRPFKKLNASAKTINENFKKLQSDLKKVTAEKVKISEELNEFKNLCGSTKELENAIKLSTRSLKVVEEYRKLGTPKQFKEALETVKTSEEKLTKLNEDLNSSKEAVKVNETANQEQLNETAEVLKKSANYIQKLKTKLAESRVSKKELFEAGKALQKSKAIIKTLTETANKSGKLVEQYKKLQISNRRKDAQLNETVEKTTKLMNKFVALREEYRALKKEMNESVRLMKKATKFISEAKGKKVVECDKKVDKEVKKTDKKLTESLKRPTVRVRKADAVKLSEGYGCTIETAAKLIAKNGVEKATKLLESATKRAKVSKRGLIESKQLVEEASQLDKVTEIPAEKTAKDFLATGMIKNYFNHDALGKEVVYKDFSKLDGTKNAGYEEKIDELFKKFTKKPEVEDAPKGLDKELTPSQVEAEAKKLLK